MQNFTLTATPITANPDHWGGLDHNAWSFTIVPNDPGSQNFTGIFRAGLSNSYATEEDLHQAILDAHGLDISTAIEEVSDYTLREYVALLAEDFGYSVRTAFDLAENLLEIEAWYDSLTQAEKNEMDDIRWEAGQK